MEEVANDGGDHPFDGDGLGSMTSNQMMNVLGLAGGGGIANIYRPSSLTNVNSSAGLLGLSDLASPTNNNNKYGDFYQSQLNPLLEQQPGSVNTSSSNGL